MVGIYISLVISWIVLFKPSVLMLLVRKSNDGHQSAGSVITKHCTRLRRVQTTGLALTAVSYLGILDSTHMRYAHRQEASAHTYCTHAHIFR